MGRWYEQIHVYLVVPNEDPTVSREGKMESYRIVMCSNYMCDR
jgi:hypothetical protein